MTRTWTRYGTAMGMSLLLMLSMLLPAAEARHCRTDNHGRQHYDQGRHRGWDQHYNSRGGMSTQTRQILRGGLIGAGIGAGTGFILGRPLLAPTLIGAGIGGGLGALQTSRR